MAKASGGTKRGSGNTDYRQLNRNNADAIQRIYNIDSRHSYIVNGLIESPAGKMDLVGYAEDIGRVFQQFGLRVPSMKYDGKYDSLNASGSGVILDRSFYLNYDGNLVAHHDLFKVPKSMQGNGFSKAIMRALYKHYKEAGVKEIKVFANIDVGGYTWGRYGFSVRNKRAANLALDEAKGNGVPTAIVNRAKRVVDKFYDSHSDSTPFPMNLLADKSYGKELLKGTSWSGRIDLTDSTQRKVFEDYMNGKRPKK